jgi:tRNA (cmo5U34)-methyltransferase
MGNVGENIQASNANWSFGGDTAKEFDEHVKKSIPLYEEGQEIICQLSDYFLKDDSLVYDLGSSTGSLLEKLSHYNKNKPKINYVGVELEENMVSYARSKISSKHKNIEFKVDDILTTELKPCDLIISYYTVQFIPPRVRQDLINRIYQSLQWGGAFILFEKVRANDARFQDIFTGLYTEYKLKKGYQADEILNKQRSLKGKLEPFSSQGNIDLLKRAGFIDIISISKYICFEGFLCIK